MPPHAVSPSAGRLLALTAGRHGGSCPALNLPVQSSATPHLEAQAYVVAVTRVIPHAVHEDHAIGTTVRLALGAFAPVSDSAGDEDLPVAQRTDAGRGDAALSFPLSFADAPLGIPVPAHALGLPPPAFLVAQPGRAGEVPHPERDRTLGHAEFSGDPLVVQATLPEFPGGLPQPVLGVRAQRPRLRRLAPERLVQRRIAADSKLLLDLPS